MRGLDSAVGFGNVNPRSSLICLKYFSRVFQSGTSIKSSEFLLTMIFPSSVRTRIWHDWIFVAFNPSSACLVRDLFVRPAISSSSCQLGRNFSIDCFARSAVECEYPANRAAEYFEHPSSRYFLYLICRMERVFFQDVLFLRSRFSGGLFITAIISLSLSE